MDLFGFLLHFYLLFSAQFTSVIAITLPQPAPQDRPARPQRPHPASNNPPNGPTITYNPSCGMRIPTKADWDAGMNVKVSKFIEEQFAIFFPSAFDTFPLYMRDKFAPDVLESQMKCDGVGPCSITDCQNLGNDLNDHDKLMAYYFFEMLSNIDIVSKNIAKALNDALELMQGRIPRLVLAFTAAERLQNAAIKRREREKAILGAVTGFLLLATAFVGAASAFAGMGVLVTGLSVSAKAALGTSAQISTLAANAMVNVNLFAGNIVKRNQMNPRENTEHIEQLTTMYQGAWSEISDDIREQNSKDITTLMTGNTVNTTSNHQNIADMLKSGEFLGTTSSLYQNLKDIIEKHLHAVAVNGLWMMERPYIVDTDTVDCESDRRGPDVNKVCLPERPGRAYWLYHIDHSEENDHGHNSQATVKGPPGYRNFLEGTNSRLHNVTLKDVIRSSLWFHENPSGASIIEHGIDIDGLNSELLKHNVGHLGSVPGAFTIPICRNPGGESISSVWERDGQNYPCMCGEFSWNDPDWNFGIDETTGFLIKTGLRWSEDFEDYCSHELRCKGKNSMDWKPFLDPDHYSRDDWKDSQLLPKELKHPFKKCKKPKEHDTIGQPNKDIGTNDYR